jgi:hypothetical protein
MATQIHKDKVQTDSLSGIAKLAVEIVGKQVFEVRRGATRWLGFEIAFGNDGNFQQEPTRKEVEWFVRYLDSVSVTLLAFATSADGYCWLQLLEANRQEVEGPSVDELDDAIWLCHWVSGLYSAEAARRISGFDANLVSTVIEAARPTATPQDIRPHIRSLREVNTAPQVAAGCGIEIGGWQR